MAVGTASVLWVGRARVGETDCCGALVMSNVTVTRDDDRAGSGCVSAAGWDCDCGRAPDCDYERARGCASAAGWDCDCGRRAALRDERRQAGLRLAGGEWGCDCDSLLVAKRSVFGGNVRIDAAPAASGSSIATKPARSHPRLHWLLPRPEPLQALLPGPFRSARRCTSSWSSRAMAAFVMAPSVASAPQPAVAV